MLSNQLRRAGWMTVLVKNCRFGGGGAVSGLTKQERDGQKHK
jgi:hypothetical protein